MSHLEASQSGREYSTIESQWELLVEGLVLGFRVRKQGLGVWFEVWQGNMSGRSRIMCLPLWG